MSYNVTPYTSAEDRWAHLRANARNRGQTGLFEYEGDRRAMAAASRRKRRRFVGPVQVTSGEPEFTGQQRTLKKKATRSR